MRYVPPARTRLSREQAETLALALLLARRMTGSKEKRA